MHSTYGNIGLIETRRAAFGRKYELHHLGALWCVVYRGYSGYRCNSFDTEAAARSYLDRYTTPIAEEPR